MKKLMTLLFSVVLASSIFGNAAMAENYFGVGIGSADIEGTDDSSIKIFGGYRNPNYGFEVAYHDLGKQEETVGVITGSAEVTGLELSAVGYLPVSSTIDVFGKLGFLLWDMDLNLTGFPSVSEDGSDFIYGIGVQYNSPNNFALRLEFQAATLDVVGVDFDTEIILVGATYNF